MVRLKAQTINVYYLFRRDTKTRNESVSLNSHILKFDIQNCVTVQLEWNNYGHLTKETPTHPPPPPHPQSGIYDEKQNAHALMFLLTAQRKLFMSIILWNTETGMNLCHQMVKY